MANPPPRSAADLTQEIAQLHEQLQEAEDLITAIRTGTIDALAVQGANGPRIFTLEGADQVYRTLIEQMNEGALLLSQSGMVLYCNAHLATLLGRPLQAVMGTSFVAYVPEELRAAWAQLLAAGWAGRSKGELPLETADGQLQPFAFSLTVLSFTATPMLAIIVTDLADKRELSKIQVRVNEQRQLLAQQQAALRLQAQAQAEAERLAAENRRILEGMPHMAWTADLAGHATYLNRRWVDYTGEPAAASSTGLLFAYVHPDDGPLVQAQWAQSLREAHPLELECRLRQAAGDYRWMLARALPSRNERGELVQWIGSYTDIHEQKLSQQREAHTQQQLRVNNEQLTRTNADLDTFVYTASHDLKAPITNIEGLLTALREQLPAEALNADLVPQLLDMMQGAVERFQLTIQQLTDVSRLQALDLPVAEPVGLAPILAEVRLDLQALLQSTGGQLLVDLPAGQQVYFSAKNLRSLFYNLLSNALKYHHPARLPLVHVRGWVADNHIVLEVEDNGLGLTPEQQGKLFRLFRRLHDHVEGSGVGLYMVKKMVENAAGTLTVTSEAGTGSIFRVTLPGVVLLAGA